MLYDLHNQGQNKYIYTCNNCQIAFKQNLDEIKKENPEELNQSIESCIQSLIHACQCQDENCCLNSCLKMKCVIQHTKICEKKINGDCPIYKRLIALCCYYAKHCQETKCSESSCLNINFKLKEQQQQEKFIIRFHCTVCNDFDLCSICKEKVGHEHKMTKLGFHLDDGSNYLNEMKQIKPQKPPKQPVQRCIHSLVHACQCRDTNCRFLSCQKMKRVVQHAKNCKRRTNGSCATCKQLIAVCCYHAKLCQEPKCSIPFCASIKQKFKEQQQQHRQVQLMRRRMASMTSQIAFPNLPHGSSCPMNAFPNQQQIVIDPHVIAGLAEKTDIIPEMRTSSPFLFQLVKKDNNSLFHDNNGGSNGIGCTTTNMLQVPLQEIPAGTSIIHVPLTEITTRAHCDQQDIVDQQPNVILNTQPFALMGENINQINNQIRTNILQETLQDPQFAPTEQLPSNSSTTIYKKKQLQQRLLLLLHARKCDRRENETSQKCLIPQCKAMKEVLSHMENCLTNKDCLIPHCVSSRGILGHWDSCIATDCIICNPSRQKMKHSRQRQE